MKIAMLNTMYAPRVFGGAERAIKSLAQGLVAEGHEVAVLASAPRRGVATDVVDGVRVHEVGLVNIYWPYGPKGAPPVLEPAWHLLDLHNPWMIGRAKRILEEEAPDVVHTNNLVGFSPGVWRAAAELGLPIVHTLYDHRLLCVRATMFKRGRACLTRCVECRATSALKRGPSEEVDVVVGVGKAVLAEHVAAGFFPRADTEVVTVPMALDDVPKVSSRSPTADNAPLQLGYLGRLQSGKGVELLLDAVKGLPDRGWELRVAGSGEGPYEQELRRRPTHPNVCFLGRVDASSFLDGIDALIVPSQLYDAAPLVVPEAYAHGVPVLGSRRGGIPELIDEGRTGYLFDPDSPEELAGLLGDLLERPGMLEGMRDACLERVEQHRSDRMVDGYLGSYRRAIGRRAERAL